MKVVKRASERTSQLDHAKRKVKAPTLAPVGFSNPRASTKITSYAKSSPLGLSNMEGPLTLNKLGKPSKINTKIKF